MADIDVTRGARDGVVERTGFRLSWGAVFAGFVIATVLQWVLSLLGLAIGLDDWSVGEPARGFAIGTALWFIVTALVTLWLGGATAGRLAGVLTRGDGAIHGLLVWGLSTLLAAWLLVSGAGFLVGGAFGIIERAVGATIGAAGRVGGAAVGAVGSVGREAVSGIGSLDASTVQAEIEMLLSQTGDPALAPDSLQQALGDIRTRAEARGVSNEQLASEIAQGIQARAGQVDRQDVINVVTSRTDLSPAEAEQLATRLEGVAARVGPQVQSAAEGAREQAGAAVDQAGQVATDTANRASEALSTAAWWALLALGLSAAAAAWGAASTARE